MKTKLLALFAVLAFACAPSVGHTDSPSQVDIAVFDPTTGNIPLPNDLALIPSNQAGLPAAQVQLLTAFAAKGGFPSDQEVPITISFQTQTINSDGTVTDTAPTLDLSTFAQSTGHLVVFLQTASSFGTIELDPIQPTDYANGTLTLHNKGHAPWAPGEYIVGIRGGPNGVKTADAQPQPIVASSTFFLIAQGNPLTSDTDLALLRAQAGTTAAALALAAQLNAIIANYKPAFAAVDQVFPHQELAVMTTFAIAPAKTQVQLDPNRGLVPLPIDLLRDPRPVGSCPTCGLLTPVAACTLASGTLDANGNCSSSAAAGFAALDGFSTTGFILAPTSDLLLGSTVTSSSVQLYDLTSPAAPALVDPSTYITEPAEVQQSGLSPTIALQPAGATSSDATSVFRTRPLKENTEYAVVIGDGVKDKTGASLAAGTVSSILQITAPLVDATGVSQLSGVDNTTAGALEVMREQLVPVLAAANASGITTGHVAMAYTFKTQSILSVATQLGALPYLQNPATANTQPLVANTPALTPLTPAQAFAKYGVPPTVVNGTGGNDNPSNIQEIDETAITTFNLLDPTTGAFNPDPTKAVAETINVMIAFPKSGSVPPCPGGSANPLSAFGNCSPLVVFRHGLGRGRADMLTIADSFNVKGMTVIAIDAAKHGDRSFCTPTGLATQCAAGFTCKTLLPAGAQADVSPPGCCVATNSNPAATSVTSCGTTSGFQYLPVSSACGTPGSCGGYLFQEGIPAVSANYLVSANFFRTRDTMRQDIIDESQLVRAIAFVPTPTTTFPTGHNIVDHTVPLGYIVDPSNISFVGQSLGSIQGTVDVATNPRIGKAVLNVGGGTATDIFANSPAFVANTDLLLAGLNISPGTSAYLQFLVVAKTILDPADPINFAQHLTANTLPNLLADPTGKTAQAAKSVLTQVAFCDQTVPNPFEFILDSNIACGTTSIVANPALGTQACTAGPLPYMANFGAPGTFELFFNASTGGIPTPSTAKTLLAACPAPPTSGLGTPGLVTHGFITDWVDPSATQAAQADAAKFLSAGTLPPSLQVVP
jgi:hypothetical protein